MTKHKVPTRDHEQWARFRFSVVGPLLAAPPAQGELRSELQTLADKIWTHPITGEPVQFAFSTIEAWLYRARANNLDPVASLRQKLRTDMGTSKSLSDELKQLLMVQHQQHPRWSYQLHQENLIETAKQELKLTHLPSYATVLRFMKAHGLFKQKRKHHKHSHDHEHIFQSREVRSFESEYIHGLWHSDFHLGSRKVLTRNGQWHTTKLLGVLDDRSRLCCHLQWYLGETTEHLVHGLCQAFQKRGLPKSLLTDNGSALVAKETTEGLLRLGIIHNTTLPYSPHQNGKQECFWGQIEGRLMAMLENVKELTLEMLNEATQAWVELEYNHKFHDEIGQSPVDRCRSEDSLTRPCPDWGQLVQAFTGEYTRTQRRSDGTVSIQGNRFELPNRYRHMSRITVRYAQWDLSQVWLTDPQIGTILCRLYPLDKEKNSDGRRRTLEPLVAPVDEPMAIDTCDEIAPLLKRLMSDYAATGLPPAYLKKDEGEDRNG